METIVSTVPRWSALRLRVILVRTNHAARGHLRTRHQVPLGQCPVGTHTRASLVAGGRDEAEHQVGDSSHAGDDTSHDAGDQQALPHGYLLEVGCSGDHNHNTTMLRLCQYRHY